MTDADIIEKVLDGWSLRTFMVPDPAIPSNAPRHMETYDLPHLVIDGGRFWAWSRTLHLMVYNDVPETNLSFCYSNIENIFCSYRPDAENGLRIMAKSRYAEHEWTLRRRHRLVWDSTVDGTANAIKKEIENASRFTVAMLDEDNIWNIHPVQLPFFYEGSGLFELRTESERYPLVFRTPDFLHDIMSDTEGLAKILNDPEIIYTVDTPAFSTFYSLYSDGTYFNYFDITRASRQKYKRLKVFSDDL